MQLTTDRVGNMHHYALISPQGSMIIPNTMDTIKQRRTADFLLPVMVMTNHIDPVNPISVNHSGNSCLDDEQSR